MQTKHNGLPEFLEPMSSETPQGDLVAWFLASIAISLKRIADGMQHDRRVRYAEEAERKTKT